jgi:hypothetical protein
MIDINHVIPAVSGWQGASDVHQYLNRPKGSISALIGRA